MWIKTQDNQLVNLDRISKIYINGRANGEYEIVAYTCTEIMDYFTLGTYKTKKDALTALNAVRQQMVIEVPCGLVP